MGFSWVASVAFSCIASNEMRSNKPVSVTMINTLMNYTYPYTYKLISFVTKVASMLYHYHSSSTLAQFSRLGTEPTTKTKTSDTSITVFSRLRLRLRQGFIQHKIAYESFTSGLHCKTIRTYWTKYEPGIIKNTCWETSTKIIADRFRRGHPEGGGVMRSVVGI